VTGRSDGAQGARHIIGEVQRFGLLSAASVVDRYVEIVNRESLGDPLRHVREALGGTSEGSVGGAARMLEAGLQALDASARLISDAVAAGTEALVLPPTEPGRASEASVWIHNRTSSLVASVQLHATILVSAEESSIPGDAVRFQPDEAVEVEPGTCREVAVRVSVPDGQPLGLYHGLLVGSGAPDGAITLRLAVQGPGGGST
jgi:hypothetical protein